MTVAESELDFRITTDTPYLALTDDFWCVFCEDFTYRIIMAPHCSMPIKPGAIY